MPTRPGNLDPPGPPNPTDQATPTNQAHPTDPAELANPFLAQIFRLNRCADRGTVRLRHVSVTMRRAQVMLDEASHHLRLSNTHRSTFPPARETHL